MTDYNKNKYSSHRNFVHMLLYDGEKGSQSTKKKKKKKQMKKKISATIG